MSVETRIEGGDGWIELRRDGMSLLAKGDPSLAERLLAALDAAGDDDPVDVVTDELSTGGVRRAPDFAIVDGDAGRVLVRGVAVVRLDGEGGSGREVVAPARGPWTDEDLGGGVHVVTLATDEPATVEPDQPEQPAAPSGWALPSVFGAAGSSGPGGPAPAERPETTEAAGSDLAEPGPSAEDEEELPSYDFLFGNTNHHRRNLLSAPEDEEEAQGPIDSGPVAAAGGYQTPEDPGEATLAPPTDEDEAPAEQAGVAPGPDRPQFVDGHLVGSRATTASGAGSAHAAPEVPVAAPGTAGAPASEAQDESGIISAVPWGSSAPSGREQEAVAPGPGPQVDDHAADEHDGVAEPEEEPSGPMVLAVRCGGGHLNAPHATRCRICGHDVPTQQPVQSQRPALGRLRLSTGDMVTLDRGVLLGRSPRAAEETGASAPHVVRVTSPDNEISRNHVEVVLDGWHVLVRDLGSTNGTTVALPGSSPVRVRPGDQQTIEPGTTITLADQVSMLYEVTG